LRRLSTALAFLLALCGTPARAGEDGIAVLASIKPVHSIAAAVMAGARPPDLLLAGAASPHSYALRPSDARKIVEARVIFWIGPSLETFLAAPLARAGSKARVVALADAAGVMNLPAREGGLFEADEHEHGDGEADPHLWLDPRNGAAMAAAMAEALAAADPPRAELYRRNAQSFAARMQEVDRDIAQRLTTARTRPYIVLHDAYHYFEDRYGLAPAGAVTVAADRPVGVRRILDIRERIKSAAVACVFAPAQFSPKLVNALTEGTAVRTATLDDLGTTLPAGEGLYEALLHGIAAEMQRCLAP
jgi:zinc transport system substrate-binding protein